MTGLARSFVRGVVGDLADNDNQWFDHCVKGLRKDLSNRGVVVNQLHEIRSEHAVEVVVELRKSNKVGVEMFWKFLFSRNPEEANYHQLFAFDQEMRARLSSNLGSGSWMGAS